MICSKCKIDKDSLAFSKDKHNITGFQKACKECRKVIQQISYVKNREKILEKKSTFKLTNPDLYKKYRSNRKENIYLSYHNFGASLIDNMYYNARTRAINNNLEFNISKDDIVIPDICPVIKKPFYIDDTSQVNNKYSPSLDRIIPDKGYIKGNVRVISTIANFSKNKFQINDLIKVYYFYINGLCYNSIIHNTMLDYIAQKLFKRTRKKNKETDIVVSDIKISIKCPALDVAFDLNNNSDWRYPSVDRIDNTKGYYKSNIIVVSRKANTIKSSMSIEDMKNAYSYYTNEAFPPIS